MMIRFRKKRRIRTDFVEPDEIFLDAKNLPEFDTQQFEGRMAQSIGKKTIVILGIIFLVFGAVGIGKLSLLQLVHGQTYFDKSEKNSLDQKPIFANRGVFYDRNGLQLVKNVFPESHTEEVGDEARASTMDDVPKRDYYDSPGFAHVLGYVSYPKQDNNGAYWQTEVIGKSGAEKEFNDVLAGENGKTLFERDAYGASISQNQIDAPEDGKNITLSIDARLQTKLYSEMELFAEAHNFSGGTGIIMDVENGELLTLTNYPEFDPEIVSLGKDATMIKKYLSDTRTPFLNRAIAGLYTPGSIVKPFVAMGVLEEDIIDPYKQILSTGSISIPNPYDRKLETIFKDNKAHGLVDLRHAIAVSSNVYFYEVGGGYKGQQGLGIDRINKYLTLFGLGEKTGTDIEGEADGIIPNPAWKAELFHGEPWRIGDTYNTAIGQYGVTVTPLSMVRAVGAIANNGTLLTPVIQKDTTGKTATLPFDSANFKIIHEAMRLCVTDGTGQTLNTHDVEVAVKTGTAQVGISKTLLNSWSMGFFPYEHPKYAFIIMMERGPKENQTGSSIVMRHVLDWMAVEAPEYLKGE